MKDLKNMKCQRTKIDGNECISKRLGLDNNSQGIYWNAIPVCSNCYRRLNLLQKSIREIEKNSRH